jgi:hypothetical protein
VKDEILLSLLNEVKPRIELDWDKIDHRFIPKDENKHKKSRPVSSDTSSDHREFLKDVFDNPDIPITIRGDRLGYNPQMTTKLKDVYKSFSAARISCNAVHAIYFMPPLVTLIDTELLD